MERITVDKIKELFDYPIGIKDKDKFNFTECSGFNGEYKAIVFIPHTQQSIQIDITEELGNSLSSDWNETLEDRMKDHYQVDLLMTAFDNASPTKQNS